MKYSITIYVNNKPTPASPALHKAWRAYARKHELHDQVDAGFWAKTEKFIDGLEARPVESDEDVEGLPDVV